MRRLHTYLFFAYTTTLVAGSLCTIPLFAQDSSQVVRKWQVSGFVKLLQSLEWNAMRDSLYPSSLLHQRLRVTYAHHRWKAAWELRTRIYNGSAVRKIPGFTQQFENSTGLVDLSWVWMQGPSLLGHSIVDRWWGSYESTHWRIRAGRQRINWGMHTIWNPNDLFNTYNFLDFDYEERPGTDALQIRYAGRGLQQAELAFQPGKTWNRASLAMRYGFHRGATDFQFIGGLRQQDWVLGAGWAGRIGPLGFTGEASWFISREATADTTQVFTLVSGLDYLSPKGWYLSFAGLFNSSIQGSASITNWQTLSLSPKLLTPFRYTFYGGLGRQWETRWNLQFSALYAPSRNTLLLFPFVTYNLRQNWDADLVLQGLFAEGESRQWTHIGTAFFARIRRSF